MVGIANKIGEHINAYKRPREDITLVTISQNRY